MPSLDVVRAALTPHLPAALKPYDPVLLLAGALLVVLVIGYIFKQRRPSNAPPLVAGKWVPFIGAALSMRDPVAFVRNLREKFGPVFTTKVFGQRLTYMISPESQTVFFKATDDQLSAQDVYKFMVPVFGKGVVYDATPEIMMEQIKLVRGGLTAEKLRSYVSKMVAETEDFFSTYAPNVGDTTEINMLQSLADLTILTASRSLMGDRLRARMGARVTQLYHDFDAALDLLAFFMPRLPLPKYKRRDAAHLEMKQIFGAELAERRARGEKLDDLVDVLMNSTYRDGTPLPDDHIKGMLIGLLFAGQHTSSITATWTGLMLLHNPAYLKRVLDEQAAVLKEFNGEINFDSLKKMTVLENAVRESLRMFPPLIFLMRKARVPIVLEKEGYTIPVGDYCVVSPAVGHRNPDVFANPDTWDPDRFAPPRQEHLKVSFGWFGFGGGRHGCIGENFGIQQVKTIWAILLRDFKWTPIEKVPPPDYSSMVVGPMPPVIIPATRIRKSTVTKA